MRIKQISLSSFNEKHKNNQYFIDIKDVTYIFSVQWNSYCDCAFLSITDYENNPIISSIALTNNLKIRTKKLPYTFYFLQINGETYEPELNTIGQEFALFYDDEEAK